MSLAGGFYNAKLHFKIQDTDPSLYAWLLCVKCEKIASEFGYKHLSTGDLLREEQKKESELATKIAECIRCAIPILVHEERDHSL